MFKTITMIGPLISKNDVVGGAKVSFESLLGLIDESLPELTLKIISTTRPYKLVPTFLRPVLSLIIFVKILFTASFSSFNSNYIFVNGSSRGIIYTLPFYLFLSKLSDNKLIIRVFGGNFDKILSSNYFSRFIGKYFLTKIDALLLQTINLVGGFKDISNVIWYPTTRSIKGKPKRNLNSKISFGFVGHITIDKGVDLIIDYATYCEEPENVEFNFFGASNDVGLIEKLAKLENCNYKGKVSSLDLIEEYKVMDVLLLPTTYKGEGYPGVIIEAFQSGVPVIASNWMAIPELVKDNYNGFLVEPGSYLGLKEAIEKIRCQSINYCRLSQSAFDTGMQYTQTSAVKRLKNIFH